MNLTKIEHEIGSFVARRFPGFNTTVSATTSLMDGDLVDSLGILEIVVFLGEQFAVELTDDDFLPENFQSVASIAGLVASKIER
jgi:acyl carrier protein